MHKAEPGRHGAVRPFGHAGRVQKLAAPGQASAATLGLILAEIDPGGHRCSRKLHAGHAGRF